MKNFYYYVTVVLFASTTIISMELVPTYTFMSDEKPPYSITVPLAVAKQCNKIKMMLNDIQSNEPLKELVPNTTRENLLEFVSYLKKIQLQNNTEKNQFEKKLSRNILATHIETFNTPELINLAHMVDFFDVHDMYKHYYLIGSLDNKICTASIEEVNNSPLKWKAL